MLEFCKGRLRARLAETKDDIRAAQRLRTDCFRAGRGAGLGQRTDADAFDDRCQHLLVEPAQGGAPLGTCRFMILPPGRMADSYSAQFYGLTALDSLPGPKLEIGRFCLDPACRDVDALRLAWAALTRVVDGAGVAQMFGCSSFAGTDPQPYADALAHLGHRHLGPPALRPDPIAAQTLPLVAAPHDPARAQAQLPPLLRSYLAMGGWVGDHVVVDRDLGTLHVLTVVDVAAIPPARARLLRMDAA